MIVRTWSGWTASSDEDAYQRYMEDVALPGYTRTPGNRGVLMVKRPAPDDRTEFLMITLWDSMEAVRAFAGPEPSKAVFYADDERYLVDRQWEVSHYEVYGETPGIGDVRHG